MIGSGSVNVTALITRPVVRSVAHPKYHRKRYDFDVGVVKVEFPFIVSPVRKPIALVKAGEDPAAGEPVVVAGWGINDVSIICSRNFVHNVREPPHTELSCVLP